MNRLSILAMLAALMLCFSACQDPVSKQFKAMEEEIAKVENKINTAEDCDDIQMSNFGIMGLRSDLENLIQDAVIPDEEIAKLDEMLTQLEATWNGKNAAFECDQNLSDDEMDTSGEEDGEYPD